jgi:hypothetical protein
LSQFCHFDEGDSSDSELAKQIFASNSTKIGDILCGISGVSFDFAQEDKALEFGIFVLGFI